MTTWRWTSWSGRSEMRLRTVFCFAALAPAFWIGCSDSSSGGTSPDAGANVAEGGAARGDGALPEGAAMVDAGLAPEGSADETAFPGAWSTAPGTPAYCNLRIADNPATLASRWIACPSGRAGCRQLDTSWTKNQGERLDAQRLNDPVRLVGGIPYFKIRRTWPPADPTKGPYFAYLSTLDDVIASRGGNLLMVGGKIVGAIGVSGGSGSQDNVVSLAGQAALK